MIYIYYLDIIYIKSMDMIYIYLHIYLLYIIISLW